MFFIINYIYPFLVKFKCCLIILSLLIWIKYYDKITSIPNSYLIHIRQMYSRRKDILFYNTLAEKPRNARFLKDGAAHPRMHIDGPRRRRRSDWDRVANFLPGWRRNERECAKTPAEQQSARLATGGTTALYRYCVACSCYEQPLHQELVNLLGYRWF